MNLKRHRLLKYLHKIKEEQGKNAFVVISEMPKKNGLRVRDTAFFLLELERSKEIGYASSPEGQRMSIKVRGSEAYKSKKYLWNFVNIIGGVAKTWLTIISVSGSIVMLGYTIYNQSQISKLEKEVIELKKQTDSHSSNTPSKTKSTSKPVEAKKHLK